VLNIFHHDVNHKFSDITTDEVNEIRTRVGVPPLEPGTRSAELPGSSHIEHVGGPGAKADLLVRYEKSLEIQKKMAEKVEHFERLAKANGDKLHFDEGELKKLQNELRTHHEELYNLHEGHPWYEHSSNKIGDGYTVTKIDTPRRLVPLDDQFSPAGNSLKNLEKNLKPVAPPISPAPQPPPVPPPATPNPAASAKRKWRGGKLNPGNWFGGGNASAVVTPSPLPPAPSTSAPSAAVNTERPGFWARRAARKSPAYTIDDVTHHPDGTQTTMKDGVHQITRESWDAARVQKKFVDVENSKLPKPAGMSAAQRTEILGGDLTFERGRLRGKIASKDPKLGGRVPLFSRKAFAIESIIKKHIDAGAIIHPDQLDEIVRHLKGKSPAELKALSRAHHMHPSHDELEKLFALPEPLPTPASAPVSPAPPAPTAATYKDFHAIHPERTAHFSGNPVLSQFHKDHFSKHAATGGWAPTAIFSLRNDCYFPTQHLTPQMTAQLEEALKAGGYNVSSNDHNIRLWDPQKAVNPGDVHKYLEGYFAVPEAHRAAYTNNYKSIIQPATPQPTPVTSPPAPVNPPPPPPAPVHHPNPEAHKQILAGHQEIDAKFNAEIKKLNSTPDNSGHAAAKIKLADAAEKAKEHVTHTVSAHHEPGKFGSGPAPHISEESVRRAASIHFDNLHEDRFTRKLAYDHDLWNNVHKVPPVTTSLAPPVPPSPPVPPPTPPAPTPAPNPHLDRAKKAATRYAGGTTTETLLHDALDHHAVHKRLVPTSGQVKHVYKELRDMSPSQIAGLNAGHVSDMLHAAPTRWQKFGGFLKGTASVGLVGTGFAGAALPAAAGGVKKIAGRAGLIGGGVLAGLAGLSYLSSRSAAQAATHVPLPESFNNNFGNEPMAGMEMNAPQQFMAQQPAQPWTDRVKSERSAPPPTLAV